MATKFTDSQVDVIVGTYVAAVDEGADYAARDVILKELAEDMDVTVNVIRGKLVAEKVYVGKEAKAKSDAVKVGSKEDYRKAFEVATGKSLKSMENMTKADLVTLWDYMVNTFDQAVADAGNKESS
jgi:hypothetical protein